MTEPLSGPGAIPLRPKTERQPALLERVGGRAVIERVVDAFYDKVELDPELRPLFPEDMGPGRDKQKWFLEQWLGGEPLYSQRFGHPRLRRRHFPFEVTERGAGRWLRHMIEAFRDCEVGEPEIAEIVAGLGPLAKHMVNVDQDVPRNPIGDAYLT
ncbi:MAG: globin [Chloroflexi bacterium]|nr:globin [Chloroflexota bacterium]MDA1145861.1 globin [Chloroflexota bacterium]